MTIVKTSRDLIGSGRKVITTLPDYAKSLQERAAFLNQDMDVTVIKSQEGTNANA